MGKLVVAGCSVSDYTGVDYNYGELLANKLGREYLHLAAGAGSNDRIFRTVTSCIREKKITREDILIVQYTGYNRREFWSRHKINDLKPEYNDTKKSTPIRENYSYGQTIKFKIGAHEWQPVKVEQEFFKLYQDSFIDHQYNTEIFYNAHFNLSTVLSYFDIPCIYLLNRPYIPGLESKNGIGELKNIIDNVGTPNKCSYIDVTEYFKPIGTKYNLEQNNPSHFSQLGHDLISNILEKHIKRL